MNKTNNILRTGSHPIYSTYHDIAHFWMLQLLIPLGAHKAIINERHCMEDDVLHELGLSHLLETKEFDANATRQELQKLHNGLPPDISIPDNTQLAKNIQWLGKIIGLNETEQAILHFRVIASRHLPIRLCLVNLGRAIDVLYATHILSVLLNVAPTEIESALKPGAPLIRTGLISIPKRLDDLMDKISLLPGLADNLFTSHDTPYALFNDNFTPAKPARLSTHNYPHLVEDIALLKSYLSEALETKQVGVNVLIYGTPGSGKTEFVKMLAHEISRPLFEIATEDSDGTPIQCTNRFRSYRLSQHILARKTAPSLILSD